MVEIEVLAHAANGGVRSSFLAASSSLVECSAFALHNPMFFLDRVYSEVGRLC